MWAAIVTALQSAIFGLGHFVGSLGAGIFLTSLLLRVALLPLSVRLARRARRQAERMAALRPELAALQARHAKDPARLHAETMALFRRHDVAPFDGRGLLGYLVQFPVFSAMFAALRGGLGAGASFAWIANLARPDLVLFALAALLASGAAAAGLPPGASRGVMLFSTVMAGGLTLGFLFTTSSAMGLSVAAGGVVSLGQAWWLRRTARAS